MQLLIVTHRIVYVDIIACRALVKMPQKIVLIIKPDVKIVCSGNLVLS